MNHASTTTEQVIYSVSQLNGLTRDLLEDCFPRIWVTGEISNLSRPASGHLYFSLKDEGAQIRCAMFRNRNNALAFAITDGLQVIAQAKVSLYTARGDYQLIVDTLEPAGSGNLQRKFELLKQKLATLGLFAQEHKKPLPRFPKTIGIITSSTGAAIRDILSTLTRRFASIPIIIYPTLVQGEAAAPQIVQALERANQQQACDVLILARGGGSLEDLWPFNEETVAHAIFNSKIPIVTGIGHEVDFTIADFVADERAATPTAAAERVSPDQQQWLIQLTQTYQRLLHLTKQRLQFSLQQLHWLKSNLRHPRQLIEQRMQRLDQLENTLKSTLTYFLKHSQHQLTLLATQLQSVSPLSTLARGYAIVKTESDGSMLRDTKCLQIGDRIQATLHQGSFTAIIENIRE